MNDRHGPLFWSFPIGTWFYTQVRVSVFFPLLVLVLIYHLGLQLGLVFGGILFVSVLIHEFGHVVAARMTGGFGDEILIWPLGGLAFVQPGPTNAARFLTASAGPLTNLMLCLIALPAFGSVSRDLIREALNPFLLPDVNLSSSHELVPQLFVLVFSANWILLLMNLIPVFPLDGGRMLQAGLSTQFDGELSHEIYLKVGFVFAFALLLGGLLLNSVWVVVIGSIVLVFNMQQTFQMRSGESFDESFLGYDFSQGYTSLERTQPAQKERRPGLIQRWREKRKAEKHRRAEEKQQQAELQLDQLLEKVHLQGIASLTDAEKRALSRASERYKGKTDRPAE